MPASITTTRCFSWCFIKYGLTMSYKTRATYPALLSYNNPLQQTLFWRNIDLYQKIGLTVYVTF
jgi:hypothetical protein